MLGGDFTDFAFGFQRTSSEFSMPREPNKARSWNQIADQIALEEDPAKVRALAKELNEAMLTEERMRAKRRLGIATDPKPLAP